MSNQAVSVNPLFPPTQVLGQLQSGQLFYVKANPGNAVIICHPHYAEIVGPEGAVGGIIDIDCHRVIPVGKVALTYPESFKKRRKAFLTRHKWIQSTQKAVDVSVPLKRARALLTMMIKYFGADQVNSLEDEIIAQIVGVLPDTVQMARQFFKGEKWGRDSSPQVRIPVATEEGRTQYAPRG